MREPDTTPTAAFEASNSPQSPKPKNAVTSPPPSHTSHNESPPIPAPSDSGMQLGFPTSSDSGIETSPPLHGPTSTDSSIPIIPPLPSQTSFDFISPDSALLIPASGIGQRVILRFHPNMNFLPLLTTDHPTRAPLSTSPKDSQRNLRVVVELEYCRTGGYRYSSRYGFIAERFRCWDGSPAVGFVRASV
ncbi:hypothetical protein PHYPSEUDO_010764 [Phytophthora pseudosyringae]|uniref:Uncharacterized protein n=1 Tax=Phytophthora pseudosyringae TaxID=221518 RepID=A0A8T1VAA6_9STRA|nr:hypothetical protein PHYPSEUDO_010764 [Phytophthora pseudosyringae]